ncbi:beta-lactamase/transpeptidase-like protein [Epithele typhae]|uniref:beta-lactamase/transpeptidase-like protein n=1 Tax=Epithele typhae TaxID=378194 RepID=UPI00200854D3|nr:beta-lactamase/transpeptidase-like protein [Epithele typhae]KAH9928030.1 beta-lactamase/transpeptidase-like protein [Epithele typhae]
MTASRRVSVPQDVEGRLAPSRSSRLIDTFPSINGETLFGMASCSKTFLATSVGIARGKNCIPLPPSVSASSRDTKFHDLLPEELGRSLQEPNGTLDGWTTRGATADIVGRMRVFSSAYELREKWSYNDQTFGLTLPAQMHMLCAHLVAHYSGMSYADFLSRRIFSRLHMDDTTVWPSVAQRSGRLAHSWNKDATSSSPRRTHAPKNTSTAPPSLSIARYAGLCTSPGYAPIAHCNTESTSAYCKDVLSDFLSLGKPSSFAGGLCVAFRSV